MIRIGIVGIGYLGRIHASVLQELAAQFEIVGIHDRKPLDGLEPAAAVQSLPFFESYPALIGATDAVAIIASTPAHFHLAKEALLAGKAVFIEKPMCATLKEAQALYELARQQHSFVQVGHVERFNPALSAATSYISSEQLLAFEARRTAPFQQRGAEVSVVLDLLIHDLDLLLAQTASKVLALEVLAKSEQSPFADEVEVSIGFEDGLKAKLFASRISDQKKRALRLEMAEHTLELDLLEKTASLLYNADSELQALEVLPSNALQIQWLDFARAYSTGTAPMVGVEAGLRALELAFKIDARAQAQIVQNSKHSIQ